MPLDRALRDDLQRLQFGDQQSVVVIDQIPIGYGGQLAGRLLALKIGLATGRKAVFSHDADPPYVQSIIKPFFWTGDVPALERLPLIDLSENDTRHLVRFDYFAVQRLFRQRGTYVEGWAGRTLANKYGLSEDDMAKLDGWLISWLQFSPEFEFRFGQDKERLGVSQTTLGVHIRRGDKKVEAAYVPLERFSDAIKNIYCGWKFGNVFVATDDPNVISELELPQGVGLVYDSNEVRYNNANHKMLRANPEMAAEETYVAFKNFRLLCECGGIVGQDNTHFATLARSYMLNRGGDGRNTFLIDGNIAQRNLLFLRALFFLKKNFRSFVKMVIPRRVLSWVDRVIHRR